MIKEKRAVWGENHNESKERNFMDFKLSEEQELLLESIRTFVSQNFPESYWKECDESQRVPYEFLKAYADAGFTMLGAPEELGGTPIDFVTRALVKIELGKLGVPVFAVASSDIMLHLVHEVGTPEQIERCVTSLKDGRAMMALLATEPQAGSDASAIATTYTRKNGKVYLNGHKTFATNSNEAEQAVVIARNSDTSDPKKIFTAWFINPKAPGVKIENLDKVGQHCIKTCEVYLEDVEIEEKDMFGQEGNGFVQLMKGFETERLFMGALALGPAIGAFEDAARYATQRIQFKQRIGEFQLIQEKLVYMKIKIENMYNMVMKTAWMLDNGISIRGIAEYNKLYCVQSAFEVIDDAMQIFGGIGYTNDLRISRLWRDARFYRIGGGTDQIQIMVAARQILKNFSK